MKRITISLPEVLAGMLVREARRRGETVSAVVRQAIEARFEPGPERTKLPFVGIGRSGRRHTARDAEKILGREWSGDRDR
jgi:hypothetical protein